MKNLNDNAILLQSISACNLCEANFGFKPRPVFQGASNAKIIIAGQAPGRIVHETGIPFNDASGDRLRDWLGLSKTVFYDESLVAILSMAFCYPGASSSGDKPPPAICAKTWRSEILKIFVEAELIIVVGKYAKD